MSEELQKPSGARGERGTAAAGRAQDASSYEPAYLRIAGALSDEIAAGVYRAGDQLPTEPQLRARYGVSPATVRRAINILLDRGLVTTTQGKGTFVRSMEMGEAIFRLQEITDVWSEDESVEVQLLEASIVFADQQVAEKLELASDALVVLLRRLVQRRGMPLIYQIEYVTYDEHRPLVEAQLQATSLEGLLRSPQVEGVLSGRLTVEAVSLEAEAARTLQVPLASPAFRLEGLFLDFEGRPISWGRFFCRADQFRLTTNVGVTPRHTEG